MRCRMKKIITVLFLLLFLLFQPLPIYGLEYPSLNAKIVEIYDLNDKKTIYEVDSDKVTSIASLTKIVTTITAIENINNLDESVLITQDILDTVRWDASKAGIQAGDELTYRDLLYASMLPSGADATNAIAILSSGSIENFVDKMNQFASKLKLQNTHFVNVTGLDAEGHYSTAKEIRVILTYALENELFRQIYTTKEYTLSTGLVVKSTLYRYNTSNADTDIILGSKTGYTGEAGYCLSSLSNINSHEFIIIILNDEVFDNQYYHIIDTVQLIHFLLEHYMEQVLVQKDSLIKTIPVRLSKTDSYKVFSGKDISLYLPDDYDKDKVEVKFEGLDTLSFHNKVGDKIGVITYSYDDIVIDQETVLLNSKLEMDFMKIIKAYYYIFLLIPIFILVVLFLLRNKRKKKKQVI